MIRVLLADGQHIVRMGLRAVLESADDIEIVGEVETADGAVQAVQRIEVDVVLMDLRFGVGASGHQVESGPRQPPESSHWIWRVRRIFWSSQNMIRTVTFSALSKQVRWATS